MRVLAIESSCDETGVAIYDSNQGLLANEVYSQIPEHAKHGGVVPELASRDHIRKTLPLIDAALSHAQLSRQDIDGIAYTAGPGLVGALLVGATIGRALAYSLGIPALPVHHMEGHLLAPMLGDTPLDFPFLALLVSGGHTQMLAVEGLGQYELLGDTVDDAVGEAFDKTARLMGLPYPGGKALADLARSGTPNRYTFPRPMVRQGGLDFSFSGLKTHVRNTWVQSDQSEQTKADIAHAFETAVVDTLVIKCKRALAHTGYKTLIVSGGVGANIKLRETLKAQCEKLGAQAVYPPLALCTDNGAMIAYVGCQYLMQGQSTGLSIEVNPRWPL